MRRTTLSAVALIIFGTLLTAPANAQRAADFDFSIRNIMRGPEIIGRAPEEVRLLIKEHPLDASWRNWCAYVRRQARRLGIEGRVHCIEGGDLQELSTSAGGMVCVNSTSGTLALECGIPVVVLGDAVYDVPGITHQGGLDRFWSGPDQPDAELYAAFN